MKTTIFVLCLLCATSALAQSASVIQNHVEMLRLPENPLHASQHEMGTQQSLLQSSSFSYAQGERPLWEFGPISQPVPLGDIARAYRAEHAKARKAEVTLEK